MAEPALYSASVPVFLHYLEQARGLVRKVRHQPDVLTRRLVPDMFSGAEQFATAAGFATRISYPLAGREVPGFAERGMGYEDLIARIDSSVELLVDLTPEMFEGADARRVRHRAGFAELDQSAEEFLHLFGMPNFLFHMTMGFAVLRAAGVEIGKADFDGLHDYPQGFRF